MRNSNGIFNAPELIHEKRSMTCDFSTEPFSSIKIKTESTKEARILSDAMVPLNPLLNFFPKNPLIRKPIRGKRGTSEAHFIIIFLLVFNLFLILHIGHEICINAFHISVDHT